MATVINHRHHRHEHEHEHEGSHWRSRAVIASILCGFLAVYIAGIFWFGEGLAEDVRAGVREVQVGELVPDQER